MPKLAYAGYVHMVEWIAEFEIHEYIQEPNVEGITTLMTVQMVSDLIGLDAPIVAQDVVSAWKRRKEALAQAKVRSVAQARS